MAIAGESSGTVTVWDLTTGQAVGVPFVADGPISGLDFMPDGSALVVSTAAAITRVPLDGSAPVVLVDASQGSLGQAAIAPDGSWIVVPVASPDVVRIALWRPEGPSFIDLPTAEGMNARDVFVSPSGTYVGVVSADRADPFQARLAIVDVASGTVTGTIQLVDGTPGSRWAFGADDRVLVADGATTTLWGTTGEQVTSLDLAADIPVQSVFGISDGRYLTVLQDGTIDVWDGDGGRLATLGVSGTTLVDVAVAPDGNTVTTVDFFGTVQRWDIAAASLSSTAPTLIVDGVGLINSVAFAPDGSSVAVATSNGRVETLDPNGAIIRAFAQPSGNVDSVAFSPDSTEVASALGERLGPESFDDTVTIFDAAVGRRGRAVRRRGRASLWLRVLPQRGQILAKGRRARRQLARLHGVALRSIQRRDPAHVPGPWEHRDRPRVLARTVTCWPPRPTTRRCGSGPSPIASS